MNVLMAFFSAFVYVMLDNWIPKTFYLNEPLLKMAAGSVALNYMLAVFNTLNLCREIISKAWLTWSEPGPSARPAPG